MISGNSEIDLDFFHGAELVSPIIANGISRLSINSEGV